MRRGRVETVQGPHGRRGRGTKPAFLGPAAGCGWDKAAHFEIDVIRQYVVTLDRYVFTAKTMHDGKVWTCDGQTPALAVFGLMNGIGA